MGWLSWKDSRDTITILKESFEYKKEYGEAKWLDHATYGSTVYALVKFTPGENVIGPHRNCGYIREEDGSYCGIVVILTTRKNGEFSYKDMDETANPYYYDCPLRLLNKASCLSAKSAWAAEWRDKVRAKAATPKLKPGMKIKLNTPATFSYAGGVKESLTEFELVQIPRKRGVFRSLETGKLYRLHPDNYGYTLIA